MSFDKNAILKEARLWEKDGNIDKAISLYQQVLSLHPQNLKAKKALQRLQTAEKEEQVSLTAEVATVRAELNRGDFHKTIETSRKALDKFPHVPFFHNILGICYTQQNALDIAESYLGKALSLNSKYVDAMINLGIVYRRQTRLDDALSIYESALSLAPEQIEIHINLGKLYDQIGEHHFAIEHYQKACTFAPSNSEVHFALAQALETTGQLDKAKSAYQAAIIHDTENAEAYGNLAILFHKNQELGKAFTNFAKSIEHAPTNNQLWMNFAHFMSEIRFETYNATQAEWLEKLLVSPATSPQTLMGSIGSLLLQHPALDAIRLSIQQQSLAIDIKHHIKSLAQISLLTEAMSLSFFHEPPFEKILTEIRRASLFGFTENFDFDNLSLSFCASLALYCHNTDYIFECSERELTTVKILESRIVEAFRKGIAPDEGELILLSCYKDLSKLKGIETLQALEGTLSQSAMRVIQRQYLDYLVEQRLSQDIVQLTNIVNEVSKDVQKQYEENPYPRWHKTATSLTKTDFLYTLANRRIKFDKLQMTIPDQPDVLVAGCGTGQHAINVACNIRNSRVCALDLSQRSLAYAKRKSMELGLKQIDYFRGDILNLPTDFGPFNIIESVGVLHHMADPKAGWSELCTKLASGGVMKIALYSEKARRHITEVRKELSHDGKPFSFDYLKNVRKELRTGSLSSISGTQNIIQYRDFYSTSECRDLLFHSQEHCFNLRELANMIEELGLKFLGFEQVSERTIQKFLSVYKQSDALYSLELWDEFETKYPDSFLGMYHFWVCRQPEM